jgi:hypothetical protein
MHVHISTRTLVSLLVVLFLIHFFDALRLVSAESDEVLSEFNATLAASVFGGTDSIRAGEYLFVGHFDERVGYFDANCGFGRVPAIFKKSQQAALERLLRRNRRQASDFVWIDGTEEGSCNSISTWRWRSHPTYLFMFYQVDDNGRTGQYGFTKWDTPETPLQTGGYLAVTFDPARLGKWVSRSDADEQNYYICGYNKCQQIGTDKVRCERTKGCFFGNGECSAPYVN